MQRFSYLPEQVVEEILSWLPAESLIRFKCVCKSWYALIKDPKFVDKQLANQIINNNNRSNLCIYKRKVLTNAGEKKIVLSLLSYDNKTETKFANCDVSVSVNNWNIPYDEIPPYLNIIGDCNGIICLISYGSYDKVILVNPAIREFRFLPESSCIPTLPSLKIYKHEGFGYDPKTDDYKVVRIVTLGEGHGYVKTHRAEVYTLSTDSWREINNVVIEASIGWSPNFQINFNGIYYWWAIDDNSNLFKDVILAFDLSDEVFQKIPMPDSFSDESHKSLVVLNESLALFHYQWVAEKKKKFDVWVMDKFGVNGTWSKILTIGPLQGILWPLVFWKNDELLMVDTNWQVVSYNLSTKELKNHLTSHGMPGHVSAVINVRSLLSVNGGNKLVTGDNTRAVLSGIE